MATRPTFMTVSFQSAGVPMQQKVYQSSRGNEAINSHFIVKVPVSGSKVDGVVVDMLRSSDDRDRLRARLLFFAWEGKRVQGTPEFVCRASIGRVTEGRPLVHFQTVSPTGLVAPISEILFLSHSFLTPPSGHIGHLFT